MQSKRVPSTNEERRTNNVVLVRMVNKNDCDAIHNELTDVEFYTVLKQRYEKQFRINEINYRSFAPPSRH